MKRIALLLFVAGCDRTPDLRVQLHTPAGMDLFSNVSQLELTVTRDDAVLAVRTSTHPSSGVSLSGLEYGAGTVLTLAGENAVGNTIARGATCAADFEHHAGTVPMYFAPSSFFGATASSPSVVRTAPAAAQREDGTVLVAGGADSSGAALSSVDVFTPGTTTFAVGPSLTEPRAQAIAVTIPSVAVAILGGVGTSTTALGSAELYIESQGKFVEASLDPRVDHQAVVRANDDVFVCGGRTDTRGTAALATTQVLNVSSDGTSTTVAAGPPMLTARYAHAAALVGDNLYVFGGYDATGTPLGSIELLKLDSGLAFQQVSTTLVTPRAGATATPITTDTANAILVIGGKDADGAPPANAELYDRDARTVTQIPMITPRYGHTATLVDGGTAVLVTGGYDAAATPLQSVEKYSLQANGFVAVTNDLTTARASHVAVTNCDGTVLLVGGGSGAELYTPSSE